MKTKSTSKNKETKTKSLSKDRLMLTNKNLLVLLMKGLRKSKIN